ncbi:hypothetical protein [Arenimonas oryziterrae]|uniref:Uncharacterized protein n=1 Tax=Arenimonas oryziterrae DSM 21050 = YC6267 TaxID=1121015 RepID=A0A091AQ10_9GAMM|nr:hypothetical protein [Arenimonas oryziterrae]KFN41242.1 hypothetical protein N789_04965 [Arenimonas oryziterrae DSM 21050 = YC6267]
MLVPLLILGLVLVAVALPLWQRRRRLVHRQGTLTRILDLADEVERLLNRSQERMTAMQSLLHRVPDDIGAIAQASLESGLPIREAKRDVLQHRLWIQKHGETATQAELDTACAALDRARLRISGELEDLENAGAELAIATKAAEEAAQREPAALRRQQEP